MKQGSSNPRPANREAAAPPRRHWRDWLLLAGLLAVIIAGLAGLAAATGWEETMAQLARLGPGQIGILLVLSLVNYGLRGGRWHAFTRALGLGTSLRLDMLHFVAGFAMLVTPARVGELVRMRWIGRETGWSFSRTAPLVLVDRAADLAAFGLLLAGALAFSALGRTAALPVAVLALAVAWAITRPEFLSGLAKYLHRLIGRGARFFVRLRGASRTLAAFRAPRLLAVALGLGIVGWLAEGIALHLLLVWMGADVSLPRAVAIFTFATLAGGLTGVPGGLGGAEATMIALLTLDGVPPDAAIAATAVIRATTLWFGIGLGLLLFPVAERASKVAAHALETR